MIWYCSPVKDGLWPAIGKGNGLKAFFNVEYPDLCGTTRILGAKVRLIRELAKPFSIFY